MTVLTRLANMQLRSFLLEFANACKRNCREGRLSDEGGLCESLQLSAWLQLPVRRFPNEGKCEFVVGWEVKDGQFGDVSLRRVRVALVAKYPKAIHEGNGHVVLFIDEEAKPEQSDSIVSILSVKMGGMPWEALAGTVTRFEGPIRKPVQIELAGERSRLQVPGAIECVLTPIKDAVTGDEKQCTSSIRRAGSSGTTAPSQPPRCCASRTAMRASNAAPVRRGG